MIHYRLRCRAAHEFEAWFADSAAYDLQRARGEISCPSCGVKDVTKAIMAPALARGGGAAAERREESLAEDSPESPSPVPEGLEEAIRLRKALREHLREMRAKIEAETEDVGRQFARRALEMHRGEREDKPIRGEATPDEARELLDEGAPIAILPWLDEREEN